MAVIGIDLGGTKISAGIVKNKRLAKLITQKTISKSSKNKIISQISKIIEELFDSSIKAIGIGVPGLVDKKGVLYEAVNIPSLNKSPLKKILEKKFKVPIFIENDANCFALGEKHFGEAKKYKNIVGLIIGTGLGAGIIIDEKLYSGANGAAGEFGQITYLNQDIEYYCSGKFFQKKYRVKGEILFEKALKNNSKAVKIFNEYGLYSSK